MFPTRQEYRNRQALLNKVHNFWVKDVLEKSLHNQVPIELGLEERPDAVANPWSVILDTGDSSPKPLPDGTKIIDIFDQIGTGRTLLILGEPGAGKTTTLLELTHDLIARAKQDVNLLIPVVFNLSSWANKRQTIADWLVEELNSKYKIPEKIGQAWITQQQLLPLMDGLDEVKAEYRDECIAALNIFHQDYGAELVVCSRIKDYEALSQRLNFQSAIYLKSLTLEQVYNYLDNVGDELIGLRTLMAEDTVMQELAHSPLMLSIMTLTYQGVAVEDLPKTKVLEERRKQLFNDYIDKMFKHRKTNQLYKIDQVMRWLIWLAQRMVKESQTIFLIERMQSYVWLPNSRYKLVYGFTFGLSIGLFLVCFCHLIGMKSFGWLAIPLFVLLATFRGNQVKIKPIELMQWSWIKAWKSLGIFINKTLHIGLIFTIISTVKFYLEPHSEILMHRILVGSTGGLVSGIAFTLFTTIFVGTWTFLIDGFQVNEMVNTNVPNQGIQKSARNAVFTTLMGWLITSVMGLSLIGLTDLLAIKPESLTILAIIKAGLGVGLMVGIFLGFLPIIQHLILRIILYFNNYIPWNYARFLDYAAERIFLQKVGGGYIFIHRMLMEHFAQMECDR